MTGDSDPVVDGPDLPARPLCFVLMPFGKKPDGLGGIGFVHVAVYVVEEGQLADAEGRSGALQLGGADTAQRIQARVFFGRAGPAALPACCGDEIGLNTLSAIAGERAAKAQALIIGVGQHAH